MDKADIRRLICERLAEGESLRAICRDECFPSEMTVRRWALDDVEGFASQYTRARTIGYDARAEALEDDVMAEPDVQRARLIFDQRRWYLGKMMPKKYGERTVVAGDPDAPLAISVDTSRATPEQLRAIASLKLSNE